MDFNRGAGSDKLTRQGSVYNLTFDEFQNSMGGLGKDFGSMNMDELLKNIWTAEESQAMASALAANQLATAGGAAGIQRQGSLTLPRTLSQKTVDEVWRDLVRENTASTSAIPVAPPGGEAGRVSNSGRQQTLGEMTLEEFLVRAGVDINISNQINNLNNINTNNPNNNNMNSNINNINNNNASSSNNNNSLFFGANFAQNPNGNVSNVSIMPIPMQACQVVGMGGNGMMMGMVEEGMGKGNGGGEISSSLSPAGYQFGGGGGMRGKKGGPVEKVVERRQRRMIKNRESAARSRARKQAYTIELEAEVAKLKEQNEELQKKQQEIMEMQKNQSMEKINHQQCGSKKRCLRRTQTGPW